jgi:CheY-like chemotaxis protein
MARPMELTVLYAEDDPNDITLVELVFARRHPDFCLRVVRDGAQAIAYLKREGLFSDPALSPTPLLVLLDVKMPKISGIEVLRWIRGQAAFRNLPILMISSSMQDIDVLRAYELGANAYLAKPAGFKNFDDTLSRALEFFLRRAP